MMCNACGKNSAQWFDFEREIGKFGFCSKCVEEYMPEEFNLNHICKKCNKMFKFKFPTQEVCGSCWYKSQRRIRI